MTKKTQITGETWLSRDQAAIRLGAKSQTLAVWAMNGKGPIYHRIGGKCLYSESDIAAYIAANRVAGS